MRTDGHPNRIPRRLGPLALLLLTVACSIEDPSGTWWDTPFFLSTEPETLKVARAGNGDQVDFTGEDSLILFLQELDPVIFPIGDSLRWTGVGATRSAGLDSLVLGPLGSAELAVSLLQAYPALAPLVGGEHRITESLGFQLDLALPEFPSFDWIRFLRGELELTGLHHWPFALEELLFELRSSGTLIAHGSLTGGGALAPEVTAGDQAVIQGLAEGPLVLRLEGRSQPMAAPAPIGDTELELELDLPGGTASAARAQLPAQALAQRETVFTDSSLLIAEALSRDQDLQFVFHNPHEVPLELEVSYPEILREDTGDTLRITSGVLAPGASRLVQLDNLALRIRPLPDTPDHTLVVRISGNTLAVDGLRTLDTADRSTLGLLLAPASLDYFRGQFTRDYPVEVRRQSREVEDFPPELRDLHLRNLEMHLMLANPLQVEFGLALDMEVTSATGLPDTTFHLQGLAEGNRNQVVLPGMGVFLERIPQHLEFNGELRILKDRPVELWHESVIELDRIEVPGRLRVVDALWRSEPEIHEADLPREVLEADAVLWVESTIPLGGTLSAWIGDGNSTPGDTTGALRSLEDLHLGAAPWSGDGPGLFRDTLRIPLEQDALEYLRGGHWEGNRFVPRAGDTGDWWAWYQFRATSGPDTVAVRQGQEVRVTGRIEVRLRLGAE